ncbi:hypothetical protein EI94DRAFT_1699862 [Lactarius quietus]|nr:hypothetical protein EI94DRAFT_1699862 [Lactarius quietus]
MYIDVYTRHRSGIHANSDMAAMRCGATFAMPPTRTNERELGDEIGGGGGGNEDCKLPDRQRGQPYHGYTWHRPAPLSFWWLTAQGPRRPRGTPSGGGDGHPDRGKKPDSAHFDLPPLPRFHFLGAGLQLPTGLTTNRLAWLASCQIGRGGSPHNMSKCGVETGSPELLAVWRGLAAQGSVGQEARGDVGRREQEEQEEVGMRVVVSIQYTLSELHRGNASQLSGLSTHAPTSSVHYMENFAPPYFYWGHRNMGDNAGIVNNNRRTKHLFGQEASSKAKVSIRFVDVTKLQSERYIGADAQIDGWIVRSSFIFLCPWGAGLGMEKNANDLEVSI